jgi:hypothetical protein
MMAPLVQLVQLVHTGAKPNAPVILLITLAKSPAGALVHGFPEVATAYYCAWPALVSCLIPRFWLQIRAIRNGPGAGRCHVPDRSISRDRARAITLRTANYNKRPASSGIVAPVHQRAISNELSRH